MTVIELIHKSSESGISHSDALRCLIKLSRVTSAAGFLMPHLLQNLETKSADEIALIEQLAKALQELGAEDE